MLLTSKKKKKKAIEGARRNLEVIDMFMAGMTVMFNGCILTPKLLSGVH